MKFLIRRNKDDGSFVDMVSTNEEYIHEYKEIEPLPEKENHYITYEYDRNLDKVIGKYVEIPKSKEQLLEEEIEKIKRAIADEGEPDLSELGNLSNNAKTNKKKADTVPDLSELDNI